MVNSKKNSNFAAAKFCEEQKRTNNNKHSVEMKTKTNVSVIIALVAALGLLFSCGKKEQKTILVGHFASAENAPEEIFTHPRHPRLKDFLSKVLI